MGGLMAEQSGELAEEFKGACGGSSGVWDEGRTAELLNETGVCRWDHGGIDEECGAVRSC